MVGGGGGPGFIEFLEDICECGHLFELHEDNNEDDADVWLYPCTQCDCPDFIDYTGEP